MMRISWNSWVATGFLALMVELGFSQEQQMEIGSAVALVKTTRSEDSRDEAELSRGERVTVLSLNGEWARVRTEDRKLGWIRVMDLQRLLQTNFDQGVLGKVVQVNLPGSTVMRFCYCPPGSFVMGSPDGESGRGDDENRVPKVISQGFWTGQTEVTQGQWSAVMKTTPADQKRIGNSYDGGKGLCYGEVNGLSPDHPMYFVSWSDAQNFVDRLNENEPPSAGWKYALPTETQWEYACRAGTDSVFAFGVSLSSMEANFNGEFPYGNLQKGSNLKKSCVVGSFKPNGWGLYDMH
jgi:formylglycine-generating enzyme required for sulfatase activity